MGAARCKIVLADADKVAGHVRIRKSRLAEAEVEPCPYDKRIARARNLMRLASGTAADDTAKLQVEMLRFKDEKDATGEKLT